MEKQFTAAIEHLPQMIAFVKEAAAAAGLDTKALFHVELATDEVLTNIIQHAGLASDGLIRISYQNLFDPHGIEIQIRDQGKPFNPLEYKIESDGYGIRCYTGVMDEVNYQRTANSNALTLRKFI